MSLKFQLMGLLLIVSTAQGMGMARKDVSCKRVSVCSDKGGCNEAMRCGSELNAILEPLATKITDRADIPNCFYEKGFVGASAVLVCDR